MFAHFSPYFLLVPLLAFVVWRRVSKQFGRQPIRRKAMMVRIAIFSLIGVLLMLSGMHKLALAEGLVGGVLIGAIIGVVGLKLTRFEADPVRGDCYVPNSWIGGLLTVLLLGRLVWHFMEFMPQITQAQAAAQAHDAASHMMPMGYTSSPLTMLVIGLLVGYYILYFTGLLIHHRRFQQISTQSTPA